MTGPWKEYEKAANIRFSYTFSCIFAPFRKCTGDPPMFTATLEDQVVPEMEANGDPASFSLQCQVTGDPTPTIIWFRGGIKIEGETAATLTVDPIVAGTDVTIEGVEYYCKANNSFGRIRSRRALVQLANECCVLVACDVGELCSYAELSDCSSFVHSFW